ncbi:hypothetical protein BDV97DRAFT_398206 [Delphinella strobiligena]|nr:hypothetical protein BDV97DRAFT_398206 [Delphinella strobiligena]
MSSSANQTTSTSANTGSQAGEGLKGLFAKGHGVGESLRGNINSAIDGFTGDTTAQAKNESIAQGGQSEFQTGQFVKKGTMDKAL